jgi:competence CoiA-like predicted nuclease
MRLCKYKETGHVLDIAELTNKVSESLICLCCNSEVITRMGKVNAHHFAHKSKDECEYSKKSKSANSMSEFHIKLQNEYKSIGAELEVKMGNNIADCYLDGVVYEIQHSPIHIKKIQERTDNYLKHTDNELVWIIDNNTQKPENFLNENYVVNYFWDGMYDIYYKGNKYPYHSDGSVSDLTLPKIKKLIHQKDSEVLGHNIYQSLMFDEWDYNTYKEFKSIIKRYALVKKDIPKSYKMYIDNKLTELIDVFTYYICKSCFPTSEWSKKKNIDPLDYKLLLRLMKDEYGNEIKYISHVNTKNVKHQGKLVSDLSNDYMNSLIQYYMKSKDKYYTDLFYSYIKVKKFI